MQGRKTGRYGLAHPLSVLWHLAAFGGLRQESLSLLLKMGMNTMRMVLFFLIFAGTYNKDTYIIRYKVE